MVSCSKNTSEEEPESAANFSRANYDTTAIDSFSVGAANIDVAQKIKMSSKEYLDSVAAVKKKLEEEQLANEAKAKEEKEKADQEKKEKEKTEKTVAPAPKVELPPATTTTPSTETPANP